MKFSEAVLFFIATKVNITQVTHRIRLGKNGFRNLTVLISSLNFYPDFTANFNNFTKNVDYLRKTTYNYK